jgi:glycosyltransferase involved in cell wall biosynthesis
MALKFDDNEDLSGVSYANRSQAAYLWLAEQNFDVIHFPEWSGLGYSTIRAKIDGKFAANTSVIVQLHSPSRWHSENNGESWSSTQEEMERFCAENADLVISPSQYMLNWCRNAGWNIAESALVIPNLYSISPKNRCGVGSAIKYFTKFFMNVRTTHLDEIVFFGRLEIRKGINIFCAAVSQLPEALEGKVSITFLGKNSIINAENSGESSIDYINRKLGNISVKIITDYNREQALKYLKKPTRLAVIASVVENSPYVVVECALEGVNFIGTNSGGTAELLEGGAENLFPPSSVEALSNKISAVLSGKATPQARLANPLESLQHKWLRVH